MTDWRDALERRDWSEIGDVRFWLDQGVDETRTFLLALKGVVPKKRDENGVQIRTRFAKPDEVDEDLKPGAMLLWLGELEAFVSPPEDESDQWDRERAALEAEMRACLAQPEVTDGASSLSRREHAKNALAHLESLDFHIAAMRNEQAAHSEGDADWVVNVMKCAALLGYHAGRIAQAAAFKVHEPDALRGEITLSSARKGAEGAKAAKEPEMKRRIACLQDRINKGQSVSVAVRGCARELGVTEDALRQQWYRNKIKETSN